MMTPATATDLGIYVHIPFCLRKCPYCAFYSEPAAQHDTKAVVDAIVDELALYASAEPLHTVYIGGGSPTCLPAPMLCDLITEITMRLGQAEEVTVECNPAQADASLFGALRRCGVNRLSIGVQSFNADELEMLGRSHSVGAAEQSIVDARTAGFENIGLDLIFGIPGSTVETFGYSLKNATALEPTHISAYSLTWEEGTPLTQALGKGRITVVSEEEERKMYRQLCQTLAAAGYGQYEISNFARAGYECRHNLRYWQNKPVLGLGPAAAGWYRGQRTANVANIERYVTRIQAGEFAYFEIERPDALQIASETAILGLRMTKGIALVEFVRTTGYDATQLFAEAVDTHHRSGLLEQTATHLRLTEQGRSFADAVSCDFIVS